CVRAVADSVRRCYAVCARQQVVKSISAVRYRNCRLTDRVAEKVCAGQIDGYACQPLSQLDRPIQIVIAPEQSNDSCQPWARRNMVNLRNIGKRYNYKRTRERIPSDLEKIARRSGARRELGSDDHISNCASERSAEIGKIRRLQLADDRIERAI